MPTTRKVQKEEILKTTLEILKKEDFDAITARRLADILNCSVQPIFYNFASMEELRDAALKAMHDLYVEYMREGANSPAPYKGMGLAYIKFARDFPNYFRMLFMSETELTPQLFIDQDDSGNNIIKYGQDLTGFDEPTQRKFHLKVWIFTHGIATLAATGTVNFSDHEIEELLTNTVRTLIVGMKNQEGSQNE